MISLNKYFSPKYPCYKFFTAQINANVSLSITDHHTWIPDNFWVWKMIGINFLFSSYWPKNAPIPISDVLHMITNAYAISSIFKAIALHNFNFKFENAFSSFSVHSISLGIFVLVIGVNGIVIWAKFWTYSWFYLDIFFKLLFNFQTAVFQ